jgi:hypothetical protein
MHYCRHNDIRTKREIIGATSIIPLGFPTIIPPYGGIDFLLIDSRSHTPNNGGRGV